MEMTKCQVCNSLFATSGPKICTACSRKMDKIYEQCRTYLRDNPKASMRAADLAEAVEVDLIYVELLVSQGRFHRDTAASATDSAEEQRKKLLNAFQDSVKKKPLVSEAPKTAVTYGAERYGDKR